MITDSFDTSDVFISPEKLFPQSSETLECLYRYLLAQGNE